jgi:hypothetical protein
MVIDLILDRKDGKEYNAKQFYNSVTEYGFYTIAEALDNGENKDVQKVLCDYITDYGYPNKIKDFINNKNWII